ncbi:hypothetical protein GGR55DRAFT_701941 [Xylaria sp. FL0064]|nr:hypothetical protein GGR55DRAFT_701941 [Xylaria sp. FL0064]
MATIEEIQAIVSKYALPESNEYIADKEQENEIQAYQEESPSTLTGRTDKKQTRGPVVPTGILVQKNEEEVDVGVGNDYPYTTSKFVLLPLLPSSPPSALLCHIIQNGKEAPQNPLEDLGLRNLESWKAAFLAGLKALLIERSRVRTLDRAGVERALRKGKQLHQRFLEDAPKRREELANHSMGHLFEQAEKDHLKSHQQMRSWTEI